jgi:hypothetical protein
VTAFGIVGYALMSSRTVLDAMNLALRFLDLSYIFSAPVPEVGAREVAVVLSADSLPGDLARFLVERDAAAIHTVLTELVPAGVPFSAVELGFPAPADPRPYAAALGVAPVFGRPRTVLRFDVAHLRRRLPQADPHNQALAEAMCRDVVARRRLHEAGVGYQVLLDEVRQALAEEMLATAPQRGGRGAAARLRRGVELHPRLQAVAGDHTGPGQGAERWVGIRWMTSERPAAAATSPRVPSGASPAMRASMACSRAVCSQSAGLAAWASRMPRSVRWLPETSS